MLQIAIMSILYLQHQTTSTEMQKMRFVQYDQLVEPEIADAIEQLTISKKFPWYLFANVNYSSPACAGHAGIARDDPRFRESFGFSNLIFPGSRPNSSRFQLSKKIFAAFLNRQGLVSTNLLRIKANLLVRSTSADGPRPFTPHVDIPKPHWVLIYYVNDSDGDTVILDKTYPDSSNAVILHSVSPKKGRAILFDGRHYHCGTCPSEHDFRIVLNYDFL
jgi:hypothetical protein